MPSSHPEGLLMGGASSIIASPDVRCRTFLSPTRANCPSLILLTSSLQRTDTPENLSQSGPQRTQRSQEMITTSFGTGYFPGRYAPKFQRASTQKRSLGYNRVRSFRAPLRGVCRRTSGHLSVGTLRCAATRHAAVIGSWHCVHKHLHDGKACT